MESKYKIKHVSRFGKTSMILEKILAQLYGLPEPRYTMQLMNINAGTKVDTDVQAQLEIKGE